MENHIKTTLHMVFVLISTTLVFWTARAAVPFWIVVPALAVTAAAPWLRRRRCTWESIVAVAVVCIAATQRQRLSMDYANRYRELSFLVTSLLFYAGIVVTAGRKPGESVYLSNAVWLAVFLALDIESAAVSLCVVSVLVLLALLLANTETESHQLLPQLIPVAIIVIVVTLLASTLPVETGPFSASTAQGLQGYLFGRGTTYDWRAGRYSTNWWKPWPAAATSQIGSWLLRAAVADQFATLAAPICLSVLFVALAWIFIGTFLQQGPARAARKLAPSFVLIGIVAVLFGALVSIISKQLNVLMFGPSSPWMVNGRQFLPHTWLMFLALRSAVTLVPAPAVHALQTAVRVVAIAIGAHSIFTCIRQAIATQWDKPEGIGRRRDRITIQRAIKRIGNLEDDELLRDPKGSVIAMFYSAANALYPLDLAMIRGETPTELTARVARWYPDLAQHMDVLGKLFYKARYSTTEMTPEQVAAARTAYQGLLEQLKVEAEHPRAREENVQPPS